MSKKIFDIIPPQRKKDNTFSDLRIFPEKEDLGHEKEEKHSVLYFSGKKRNSFKPLLLKFLLIVVLLLVGLGVFNFFFLENVKIAIWPKTDTLNLTKAFVADVNEKPEPSLWLEKGIIPGEILNNQKDESQEFSASGKSLKEEKATGVIKVYNNFSQSPQSLVAGTRFVSSDGKLFKSIKKVSVPGGTYDKGKLVPGEIDVEVVAVESGDGYNINSSTFSIPGFAGTPKYTAFYGKSFSDMKGGFKGEVSQVIQEDLDKAEESLVGKMKNDSKELLKKNLPNGYVLLDEAIFHGVTEKNFSAKAQTEANSFTLQIKMDSKAIIFKKADVDRVAKDIIALNIPKDKNFEEDKLEINYLFKSLGFKEPERSEEDSQTENNKMKELEKINLEIAIKSKIYQSINLDEIKKTVLGKSFNEVKMVLGDRSDISKVRIEPGFLFRNAVPDDINRVKLDLKLE